MAQDDYPTTERGMAEQLRKLLAPISEKAVVTGDGHTANLIVTLDTGAIFLISVIRTK